MDDEEETYRLWKIRKTIMQASRAWGDLSECRVADEMWLSAQAGVLPRRSFLDAGMLPASVRGAPTLASSDGCPPASASRRCLRRNQVETGSYVLTPGLGVLGSRSAGLTQAPVPLWQLAAISNPSFGWRGGRGG